MLSRKINWLYDVLLMKKKKREMKRKNLIRIMCWHRVKPLLLCVATEWSLALHKSFGFGVFFCQISTFFFTDCWKFVFANDLQSFPNWKTKSHVSNIMNRFMRFCIKLKCVEMVKFAGKIFFWSWKIGFFYKKIYVNTFFLTPKSD